MTPSQQTPYFDATIWPPRRGDLIVRTDDGIVEAVAVSADHLVLVSWRRAKRVPARANLRTLFRARDAALSERIALFFEQNVRSWRVVRAGLRALQSGNIRVFDRGDLMPQLPHYESPGEFDAAWERVIGNARPMDFVFTMDSRNLVSHVIAAIDHGSWSHCGCYLQDGYILETTTKPRGTHTNRAERHKAPGVHVGLYRDHRLENSSTTSLNEMALKAANILTGSRLLGNKYKYFAAIGAGVNAALDVPWVAPRGLVAKSPNGLIYCGQFFLVDHV